MKKYSGTDNLEVMQKDAKNYNAFLVDLVVRTALKKQADRIVDFGSGTGFFASEISLKLLKKIECIEISENLFSYYQNKPNLHLYQDLSEIENTSIDLLYSFNVLEHIEQDEYYIKLFSEKIAKHGTLILYLPAFMCLYSSMDKKVGHYRRYNKKELEQKLGDKFNIETLEYADSAGFFATILYKMFGNENGDISEKTIRFFDRFIFPVGRLFDRITLGKLFGKNIICIATKK